jgi:hydroxyacylglutathione hydrolase
MAVSYEAPFIFLLFGDSKALLLDTGATTNPQFFPLRRTVDSIIDGWLADHPHPDGYGLLVLHTHSHTDHTAADGQFAGRPSTDVIGAKRDAAWPYFGFDGEPESVAEVDLGGRVLDCLATPGHHDPGDLRTAHSWVRFMDARPMSDDVAGGACVHAGGG